MNVRAVIARECDQVVGVSGAQRRLTPRRVYVRAPQLERWPPRLGGGRRSGVGVCVRHRHVIRREHRRRTTGGGHEGPFPGRPSGRSDPRHSQIGTNDPPLLFRPSQGRLRVRAYAPVERPLPPRPPDNDQAADQQASRLPPPSRAKCETPDAAWGATTTRRNRQSPAGGSTPGSLLPRTSGARLDAPALGSADARDCRSDSAARSAPIARSRCRTRQRVTRSCAWTAASARCPAPPPRDWGPASGARAASDTAGAERRASPCRLP